MKKFFSVEEAIDEFYKYNNIDRNRYLSDENSAYTQDKHHDQLIGNDVFPSRVSDWLQTFDYPDINIFFNLLGNYTYITRREFNHKVSILSNLINKELAASSINFSDTILITIPSPNGLKSGGDEIRSYFNSANILRQINNKQIICSTELTKPDLYKNKKAIVFIDDLIGSGKTIISSALEILDYFDRNKIDKSQFKFFFTGLYINKSAINFVISRINKQALSITPIHSEYPRKLLKGEVIFNSKEYTDTLSVIKTYEKQIDSYQFKKTSKSYDMGYDKCKLSISFYYNTPNNTLCNFWEYSDSHIPLFERRSQTRPKINSLKERKSNNEINAYLQKALKNETL